MHVHLRHKQAAQYLRMSTDQQDLSIGLQQTAIERYAAAHGLEIVATYQDEAKSGLRIANRSGMRQLVRDVMDPRCPFSAVLVYDVSRWGRFQNTDASAYYDYHCRLFGVKVVYVAESFDQEAGPMAVLLKNMKRAMAAEYSRELGVKVRAGQVRVIQQGFSAGGGPALGLVRQAVTRDGLQRTTLGRGERKAIQSDRVRLVPAGDAEVALVQRIFQLYADTDIGVSQLAVRLNAEGYRTRSGVEFTDHFLHRLITHETLMGDYVWGKQMQTPEGEVPAPPERHVRFDGLIEPIISREIWEKVQQKHRRRGASRRNPQRLLDELSVALRRNPALTAPDLQAAGCASSDAYWNAFGSMEAAYALLGRDPGAVRLSSLSRERKTKATTQEHVALVASLLSGQGCKVVTHMRRNTIVVNDALCLQVYVSTLRGRCKEPTWLIPRRRLTRSEFRLLFLFGETGQGGRMLLVPESARPQFPVLLRPALLEDWLPLHLPDLAELAWRLGVASVTRPPDAVRSGEGIRSAVMDESSRRPSDRRQWSEHQAWCRQNASTHPGELAARMADLLRAGNFYALRLKAKMAKPDKKAMQ
ncbi:recombinase family protein [Ramlibacter sp. AN1015]|uniref:recombinase family protein n=1 Tax=Ramlibacter sp. AN1015 TaxID=3133428 RepID=UPI0030C6191C